MLTSEHVFVRSAVDVTNVNLASVFKDISARILSIHVVSTVHFYVQVIGNPAVDDGKLLNSGSGPMKNKGLPAGYYTWEITGTNESPGLRAGGGGIGPAERGCRRGPSSGGAGGTAVPTESALPRCIGDRCG